jgi:hypothetical protein
MSSLKTTNTLRRKQEQMNKNCMQNWNLSILKRKKGEAKTPIREHKAEPG